MTSTDQHIAELDYALSMNALTLCEIESMKAQNQVDIFNERLISYQPHEFIEVANRNNMNHNSSVSRHTI